MFTNAIQFQLPNGDREWTVVLPEQLLSIRQTTTAVEFLRLAGNGSPTIVSVKGDNLGILLRAVLRGACPIITCGPYGPSWGRCTVTSIRDRLAWEPCTIPMAPDPNPTPDNFFSFETGTSRDLWPFRSLTVFAISRRRSQNQFMLQFPHEHAFVLETEPAAFLPMLKTFQASNFTLGMPHRFTAFGRNPYHCPVTLAPFQFRSIRFERRNLAARGEWEILLAYRERLRSALDMSI